MGVISNSVSMILASVISATIISATPTQKKAGESCTADFCPEPLGSAFMTFQEMEWYLKEVSVNRSHVDLSSIGKSVEGRDLWLLKIQPYKANGKSDESSTQSSVWVEGGIHAREWASSSTVLFLLHKLATDCDANCDMDYYIAPMGNPDGYEYSRTTDRMWRKNRAVNSGADCQGVDLNRNWDVEYGVGASDELCSDVYKGTNPFSEPETLALSESMKKVTKLMVVLCMHSYGQMVLYPWGFTSTPPDNVDNLKTVGTAFANAVLNSADKKVYSVENSSGGLYFASGATDDWAMKVLSVPYVFTLELRDSGKHAFLLPAEEIQPTATETIAGVVALIAEVKKIEATK